MNHAVSEKAYKGFGMEGFTANRALIIDLRKDASRDFISDAVEGMSLGRVNTVVTKLTFRYMLLKRAYTRNDFEQFLPQTKFGSIDIKEDLMGLELSLQRASETAHQKNRPGL